jgi:PAS domain S-box-containing protein
MGTPQRHADASPQTIEALQASEARYRDLFENSNDAMTTVTLDGIFMSVNRAFEALLGRSREELIGHHYKHLGKSNLVF